MMSSYLSQSLIDKDDSSDQNSASCPNIDQETMDPHERPTFYVSAYKNGSKVRMGILPCYGCLHRDDSAKKDMENMYEARKNDNERFCDKLSNPELKTISRQDDIDGSLAYEMGLLRVQFAETIQKHDIDIKILKCKEWEELSDASDQMERDYREDNKATGTGYLCFITDDGDATQSSKAIKASSSGNSGNPSTQQRKLKSIALCPNIFSSDDSQTSINKLISLDSCRKKYYEEFPKRSIMPSEEEYLNFARKYHYEVNMLCLLQGTANHMHFLYGEDDTILRQRILRNMNQKHKPLSPSNEPTSAATQSVETLIDV